MAETVDFPAYHHDTMGDMHDHHGTGPQFRRLGHSSILSRTHGGWSFPGSPILPLVLVRNIYTVSVLPLSSIVRYKRSEFGIRSAIFFSAAALAGSFGGLLAAAIAKMDGVGGKPGWAWIFILEGLATIVVGVASFWMVHDFPDEAKFLSDAERRRVLRRLASDKQGSSKHEDFKSTYLWQVVKDWKTYTGMVIYMGCDGVLYAFSLFIPTIIKNLGYTSTRAQLLTVPPYAVAAVVTVVVGYIADKTQKRGE